MKTKLVLWGRNEADEKILIAVALKAKENKVDIWVFDGEKVTEQFSNDLMNKWRIGEEVPFEIDPQHIERDLTVTESMLPDELKVDRPDIVQRAQTEWHFVVLSSRLYETYTTELEELKEKIDKLSSFNKERWDDLKSFWAKVQHQIREKNLFRDHVHELKDETNALFAKLKSLRSEMESEFRKQSKSHLDSFMELLGEIEKKIEEGLNLSLLFEELKKIQRSFRDTRFTKEHRSKVWNRLDELFKEVKKRKFGDRQDSGDDGLSRVQRRYSGLLSAIEKMDRSIERDKADLEFQDRKIASSDGQLEAQIRQAKVKMIKERIRSKEEKRVQMLDTKKQLEGRIEKEKKRAEKIKEQEEIEKAKQAVKDQIAEDIKRAETKREEQADKFSEAAEAIKSQKKQRKAPGTMEQIGDLLSDTLEDVVDTIKAVAHVVEDKVEDLVEDLKSEEE